MKTPAILIILTILLIGCKSYIQVFETKTSNTTLDGEYYVYETDTLKITYAFWNNKGILSFSVYNKLDKPIFIDWKKSSYIDNSNKFNYWIEEEVSKSMAYYGGYFYDGPILKPGLAINEGLGTSTALKVKPERITFIPPKSNYYRSQFYLLPIAYFDFDLNSTFTDTSRNDKPNKSTRVYYNDFTKDSSPLVFRNFLAFSLTEDFADEFYVDNEFYLSKTFEMDYRHFKYQVKGENGDYTDVRPFKKQTSFYLSIPKGESIDQRKKFD